MGTQWRGLLAPVNLPTDDGRRFKKFSARQLPLSLKWQRVDAMGHDDSMVVGSLLTVDIGTAAEAVEAGWISKELAAESKMPKDAQGAWGSGELFDDVDASVMPRLAEDVAEAKELLSRRVIAVSVDPIPVGAIMLVEPGQDEPPSDERMEEMFEAWIDEGVEPVFEVLFEEGMIAAATLVMTPAFSEVRPFELGMETSNGEPVEQDPDETAAATKRAQALTAAAPPRPPVDLFAPPVFDRYTEIHVVERPDGLLQVQGHFAPSGSCHLGIRDACMTPPLSAVDYAPFHRSVLELADGELLGVGRITTGFGRIGNSCTRGGSHCRGKDDHACEDLTLSQTIAHHDQQTTLAWVRAGEDEHGLYIVGVADADLTDEGRRLLEARKFSGDWREYGAGLELVELLALAHGAPAFPAPRASMRDGRRASLVACYPPPVSAAKGGARRRLAREVADLVVADLKAAGLGSPTERAGFNADALAEAAAVTAATETTEHSGAMIALRMSDEDAGRLAVEGGEPADELHLTLAYLGEGADIDADTRAAIIAAAWDAADAWGSALEADVFSVSAFNPGDANDAETAIVYGVGGEGVATAHTDILGALDGVFAGPDQHAPWHAHITAAYVSGGNVDNHGEKGSGNASASASVRSRAGAPQDGSGGERLSPVNADAGSTPAGRLDSGPDGRRDAGGSGRDARQTDPGERGRAPHLPHAEMRGANASPSRVAAGAPGAPQRGEGPDPLLQARDGLRPADSAGLGRVPGVPARGNGQVARTPSGQGAGLAADRARSGASSSVGKAAAANAGVQGEGSQVSAGTQSAASIGDLVEQLVDRVGPITFDRLRIAFAGEVTDIVLGSERAPAEDPDPAAALLDEVETALADADRARQAAGLLRELEAAHV